MTLNPIPLLAQAAALALLLTACSGEVTAPEARAAAHGKDEHAEEPHGQGAAPEAGHADAEEAAPTVTMDDDALKAAGIRIAVLVATSPGEQLRAPGEVLDSAYGTTLITPRVAALVVRRHARLGDEVRAGAPLATLASVDVSDAQAELRIAEQEWRRVSALGREAVAGRRISEARIAVDRARAKARAYGLPDTGHGSVDGRFTLPAPHAGRITEDDFVVGERIEPGRALYRLVDESVVWVDARLPSGTVPRLTAGSAATIVADGRRIPGTVLRAAHRTSEATRNAVVRIEVANEDDRLHGGDFVDVYLGAGGDAATPRLAVPSTALVQLQGDTVLFRRDAHGAIAPVPVRTGAVIGEQTVVEEGVNAGDAVVVEGAFAIKARLLKAQLGEGHAH
ncbi:efflux RND transporter periplasmic adaptor subunit [Lysobacter psychrotolerans]|uniref:Efflux RND transporter periplasmic adaptor subunit n=2 Tax=Montanilutibacter psychrotolerans TaxID=1327343 RepID=A0A3M8SMF0_9GAMM|nr:efflux RND transporter periplasmic adaptor subunit [Lysobacter psychrotolerans]